MKIRGFEKVKYELSNVKLPTISDNRSAGYDFYLMKIILLSFG